jgi:glycosyltransferase involved in cell wall biosynthesis
MLSIIIPTLNEEECLPLLLEAIKKQDFADCEVIVADAGSEDKTVEIAKNYGCKIVKGGSPARGRNEGAKEARGETLLFVDADNIFLPESFLKNLLEEFEKRKLDIASFPIYAQGNRFDKVAYGIYNFWVNLTQKFLAYSVHSVLVRKEIHQKIGGFNEEIKIGEDQAYARRAGKLGKFGFVKTDPVLTSARRFEEDGRFKTYLKYFLCWVHVFFLGEVKSDIFKYRFDHCLKNRKNKL